MSTFIPMQLPTTTHQQKQVNIALTLKYKKPHFYEPTPLKEARAKYRNALAPYAPNVPRSGALTVSLTLIFPGDDMPRPHINKPDVDNAAKLILDVMTDLGYWHDDCQISCLTVQKWKHQRCGLFFDVQSEEA